MAAVAVSLLAGSGVAHLFPFHYISAFGGAVLILLGLYIIGQYLTVILSRPPVAEIDLSETGSPGRAATKVYLFAAPARKRPTWIVSGTLSIREALLFRFGPLAADGASPLVLAPALDRIVVYATVLAVD